MQDDGPFFRVNCDGRFSSPQILPGSQKFLRSNHNHVKLDQFSTGPHPYQTIALDAGLATLRGRAGNNTCGLPSCKLSLCLPVTRQTESVCLNVLVSFRQRLLLLDPQIDLLFQHIQRQCA